VTAASDVVEMDAVHPGRLLVEAVQARRPADCRARARGHEAGAEPMDPGLRWVAAAVVDEQDPHPLTASYR
jgi:hypothetical protein